MGCRERLTSSKQVGEEFCPAFELLVCCAEKLTRADFQGLLRQVLLFVCDLSFLLLTSHGLPDHLQHVICLFRPVFLNIF